MKILVLGGTRFIGRHIVETTLRNGHKVSIFNRGHQNQDLFVEVEKLRGDRHNDLHALVGKQWDVVIDTSGYLPRAVRACRRYQARLPLNNCDYDLQYGDKRLSDGIHVRRVFSYPGIAFRPRHGNT